MSTQGTFWVDPEFRELLERAGWSCFSVVMAAVDGQCHRALPDRENWCFELFDESGHGCRFYLKKHRARGLQSWFRARLRLPPSSTPARIEMENVARLHDAGIESVRVVAVGEHFSADGTSESFLLTEELTGFLELPAFLHSRFAARPAVVAGGRNRDLDRLILGIAEVTQKFHRAGYNHRDLYGGHFFVREPRPGAFEIRLIDLQRVQQRRFFRRRWVIKDIAQLAWSLPAAYIGCRDRMAFMRHYLGVSKLRPRDKRLVREILARHERMQRKLGRMEEHVRDKG